MSITQKWLDDALISGRAMPMRRKAKCADGFEVSIQASEFHYSAPRDNSGQYWEVELGFPTMEPNEEVAKFAEDENDLTGTVYGYVPIELVDALLESHGGLVND